MKMKDKEIEINVFNISEEALVVPDNIDIHDILYYQEPGHSVADGTKKMNKFRLQVPIHIPDDYREKRFGVALSAGSRIYVKIPRHSAINTER